MNKRVNSKEMSMKAQRHLYALIGAAFHFMLVRMVGESLASNLLKLIEAISRLRDQSRK